MISKGKAPTAQELKWREIFEYKDGDLIYKERGCDFYGSSARAMQFNALYSGKVAGSIDTPIGSNTPYLRVQINKSKYFAHRIVWEMFNGEIKSGMIIDHINRNGLDNRIENLRECRHKDNSRNKKKDERNTSGYTGVTWCKHGNAWKATINSDSRRINIGNFNRKENASTARYFWEYFLGYSND